MMSTVSLILEFVFGLACLLFVARFLLQAARADFYNPLSQAIIKATDPVCKPLRSFIRPINNFDLAAILVAWLISCIHIGISLWLRAPEFLNVGTLLWSGLIDTLQTIIQFYIFTIIIVAVASFIAAGTMHPALGLLHQINEPLMAPLRRILPPFGPLDLTPMLVLLILFIIQNILRQAYF